MMRAWENASQDLDASPERVWENASQDLDAPPERVWENASQGSPMIRSARR
jgi:hypothetical protein